MKTIRMIKHKLAELTIKKYRLFQNFKLDLTDNKRTLYYTHINMINDLIKTKQICGYSCVCESVSLRLLCGALSGLKSL